MVMLIQILKKTAILFPFLLCGAARAFDISGGTGMGEIADGTGANNSPGAPLVITLNVSGTNEVVTGLSLAGALGFAHTWYGDLAVVLSHNGISVDLMDRNYRASTLDQGNDGSLNGDYMFGEPASSTVGSLPATGPAPSGTYARWHNPLAGSSTAPNSFDDFIGEALDGTWTLTFTDFAAADVGEVLGGMRIVGTSAPVPELSTVSMLLMGGLSLLRKRKRRAEQN